MKTTQNDCRNCALAKWVISAKGRVLTSQRGECTWQPAPPEVLPLAVTKSWGWRSIQTSCERRSGIDYEKGMNAGCPTWTSKEPATAAPTKALD